MTQPVDPLVAQCRARVSTVLSGKWRLDALLGVGGMAAVYRATHRNGTIAAIKVLHDEVALNSEVRERFLREAYIANKVNHPGTVKVLDDDKDERGTPYLVMELLEGDPIDALADKSGGRLQIEETLEILDQVLATLEAAHAQDIVHRDLKPENLFRRKDGVVKVLDFGIARLREDNLKRTQTGMVMGTPSFMAPEQAMGRWSEVDRRTDIYAIGATTFTLLTGVPVHEANTAGEMLVAAATRPARSLARVLNNAPFGLVALVDRALAYNKNDRFPDAASFRKDLGALRQSLTKEQVSRTQINPNIQVMPATVHGEQVPLGEQLQQIAQRRPKDQVETFDPSQNTPQEVDSMAEVFELLERSLTALTQYGDDHPSTKQRFDVMFRQLSSSLMSCDICLAWNLTPYAFVAGERVLWEPEVPWNRIPYQLFSDGVRTMGFLPGLDEGEFREFMRLLTLDVTTDVAPEDDLVTRLWDADLPHVFHQAIDSFAEGSQEQRERYEAERNAVIRGALQDHVGEAASAWQQARAQGGASAAAGAKRQQVVDYIKRGLPIDAEAAARAAQLNVQDDGEDEFAMQSLQIDGSTRALLAARLETDVMETSQRFVVTAAEAFIAAAKMGRSQGVTAPLRRAVDGLSEGDAEKAMDMVLELRGHVRVKDQPLETDKLRNTLTAEILSPETLAAVLTASKTLPDERRLAYLKALADLLQCLEAQHFGPALAFLPDAPAGKVQRLLLDFLSRAGRGHELEIGAVFAQADIDLGLELVRLLVALDTREGKEALARAADCPHALVRIEALGHIEGVSSGRVRDELRSLLDDPEIDVRLAALRAMEEHDISAAGPFLVLRIQDPAFLRASFEERAQSLRTLAKLRPKRAEEVCTNLLAMSGLFRSSALETSRRLSAELLGQIATGEQAFYQLDAVARSKPWHASRAVRDAAKTALEHIAQRAEEAAKAQAEARRTRKTVPPGARRSLAAPSGEEAAGAAPARRSGANRPPGVPSQRPGSSPVTSQRPGSSPQPVTSQRPLVSPETSEVRPRTRRPGSQAAGGET